MSKSGKNWLFTYNNWTNEGKKEIEDLDYSYLVIGKEVSSTGTPHLQGYVVFKSTKREKAVRKLLKGCHVTLAKGTSAQNKTYCSKEGDFEEFGKIPLSRKEVGEKEKVRWGVVWDNAKAGNLELIPKQILVKSYNAIKRIEKDHLEPKLREVSKTKVYWGESGAGKSHKAWEEAGDTVYSKLPTTKFWDGYKGEKNVVIDEFRGVIGVSHLLRWCDKWKTLVEVKGGATTLNATNIWITSNLHPKEWYAELDEETMKALLRRLDIYKFELEKTLSVSGEVVVKRIVTKEE